MTPRKKERDDSIREFEVEDLRDGIQSSRASRLNLLSKEFGLERNRWELSRESVLEGFKGCSKGFIIHPDNW